MKKYKYKFTNLFYCLFAVISIIAIATIVLNVIKLYKNINQNIAIMPYEVFTYVIIFAISILAIVVTIFALISSYYYIDKKSIVLKWGIVKNVINFSDILKIKYITNIHRLELSLKDDTYFVISTKEQWFDDFVNELKEKMPNITYIQETLEDKNN